MSVKNLPPKKKGLTVALLLALALSFCIGIVLLFPYFSRSRATPIQISENYQKLNSAFEQIISKNADENGYIMAAKLPHIFEDICAQASILKNERIIDKYYYKDGDSCVYIKFSGGIQYIFAPKVKDAIAGDGAPEIITIEPYANDPSFVTNYILTGFKSPGDAAKKLASAFSGLAYDKSQKGSKETLEAVLSLQSNSIVLWCGHGGYNEEIGSCLALNTKNEIDIQMIEENYERLRDKSIVLGPNTIFISSAFFNSLEKGALHNCLFYLGSCYSMTDDRLSNSLLKKGAVAVIGNTDMAHVSYNFAMLHDFFEGCTKQDDSKSYNSLSDALKYAKDKNGDIDPLVLGETWNSEVKMRTREISFLDKNVIDVFFNGMPISSPQSVGNCLLDPSIEADSISYFDTSYNYDFCVIGKGGKYGLINYDGNIILPIKYASIYVAETSPNEDIIKLLAWDDNCVQYWVETNGTLTETFLPGWGMEDTAKVYWNSVKNEPFICIYRAGFNDISKFSIDTLRQYPLWHNIAGTIVKGWPAVIPVKSATGYSSSYEEMGQEPEGVSDKYGLFDTKTEKMLTDFIFDDYSTVGFIEGVLPVMQNGKWGYVDEAGKMITDFDYIASEIDANGNIHMYSALNGYMILRSDDGWGLMNTKGEIVVKTQYDGISQVDKSGRFWLCEDGKWGVFTVD